MKILKFEKIKNIGQIKDYTATGDVSFKDVNLISFDKMPENFHANVKTRYRQKEIPSIINQVSEDELIIEFSELQRTPAKGQAAVIYDGDFVAGGGTILSEIGRKP